VGIRYNVIRVYQLFGGQSQERSKSSDLEIFDLRTPCSMHSESIRPLYKSQHHKSCMMNRQIGVKKLLVQLNVLLLVVQSKFNPLKREIRLRE